MTGNIIGDFFLGLAIADIGAAAAHAACSRLSPDTVRLKRKV